VAATAELAGPTLQPASRLRTATGLSNVTLMTDQFLSQFDPAYGKRPEFGELARRSGRTLNERSQAQIMGAENLLTKAMASMSTGQADRAENLIRRAAELPYDPREEGSPGVRGAAMLIHTLVTDRYEASEYDDSGWLDVALHVHGQLDGPGKAELASIVHGFVLQDAFFSVSRAEKRRIQQAVSDAPLEADLGDGPELTLERRLDIVRSLVTAAVALREGYAAVDR